MLKQYVTMPIDAPTIVETVLSALVTTHTWVETAAPMMQLTVLQGAVLTLIVTPTMVETAGPRMPTLA